MPALPKTPGFYQNLPFALPRERFAKEEEIKAVAGDVPNVLVGS